MGNLFRNIFCGDEDLRWNLMHLKRGRLGGQIAYLVGHSGWHDGMTCHTFIAYIALNLLNLLFEPAR